MFSERHAQLIRELNELAYPTWGEQALLGSLERLRDGGPTEWRNVTIRDAWAMHDGFCIVYQLPPQTLTGLHVTRAAADGRAPIYFAGLYAEPIAGETPTPTQFGIEIADFAVAEPLGSFADRLVTDELGVGWWGDGTLPGRRL